MHYDHLVSRFVTFWGATAHEKLKVIMSAVSLARAVHDVGPGWWGRRGDARRTVSASELYPGGSVKSTDKFTALALLPTG
jgi:hypothetical protein